MRCHILVVATFRISHQLVYSICFHLLHLVGSCVFLKEAVVQALEALRTNPAAFLDPIP